MNELEAAIQSVRRAQTPWAEGRAAAVLVETRRQRGSRRARRVAVVLALGVAASFGAWAFLGQASGSVDGAGSTARDEGAPDRGPGESRSAMATVPLADGGFETACNSCHLERSRWPIDRGSRGHGQYE